MTEADRIELIRPGITRGGGTWADLGAGSGAFTRALAFLLGPDAEIYALDRDERALRALQRTADPAAARIVCVAADFTREPPLPPLDGILLANSLHFQADACQTLRGVCRWLKTGAALIVVEYDVDRAGPWVPHPLPWSEVPRTADCAGLAGARLLGRRPSLYHGSMYAAACRWPGRPGSRGDGPPTTPR